MTATVARFVALKVRSVNAFGFVGFFPAFRHRSLVAIVRMKTVVNVAMEIVMTMKPRSGADEDTAAEPFRSVIACGSAGVRRYIVINRMDIRELLRC